VIAYLDRSPGMAALQARVERITRLLPRFRDRVAPAATAFQRPVWEPDPSFDLAFHVRGIQLPSGVGPAGVLRWAEPVVAEGLDRSRPLWQMTLVESGPPDRGAALILKLHHTFTDGLGAVKLAGVLFDVEPEAAESADGPAPVPPPARSPFDRLAGEVVAELRRGATLARRSAPLIGAGLRAALGPGGSPAADCQMAAPRTAASQLAASRVAASQLAASMDTIRSLAHLAAPSVRPLSPLLTARALPSRFEMLEAPLHRVRAAARAVDGTVNDVFLAAVVGGLGRYHGHHGCGHGTLRVAIPVSTRRAETDHSMRNQFAPVRITVPFGDPDAVARLRDVHRRVAQARAEPGLANLESLAVVANRVPALRGLVAATMRSVDVVASNVPGVSAPLYLRGARVTALVPLGPRNGAALNATVVSYDGTLHLGLNLDAAAIPDHGVLLDSLREGLAETLAT
jgi:diacylglycerol O-acyltransferase / wax synthase